MQSPHPRLLDLQRVFYSGKGPIAFLNDFWNNED